MSAACSEIVWLRGLISELGFPPTCHHPILGDSPKFIFFPKKIKIKIKK
jgi:hypothetical protein